MVMHSKGICNYISEKACIVSGCAALGSAALIIAIQIYCLLYRAFALPLTKRYYDIFMSLPVLVAFQLFGYSVGALWDAVKDIVKENETIFMVDTTDPLTKILLYLICSLLLLAELVSFVLAIGILLYLRNHASLFSKSTYKLHVQFTLLLLVQLISPLILLIIPGTIYVNKIINHESIEKIYIQAGFLTVTLYGFVNGGLTVIFVGPYRKQAYKQLIDPMLKAFRIFKRVNITPYEATSNIHTDLSSNRQ
ncbi:hypothetical protein M3Y97_01105000 [Aphelenchoides bicaudatus]|nr:hypothetical protein M3Y97_01105000 [Aphelenchoides bicaudatus]